MPIPALAAMLFKLGAPLLANAAVAKGKEWIEEKTGVKLDEGAEVSPDDAAKLRQYELENEPELARLRVEDNRIHLEDVQNARARDVEFIKRGRQNVRGDVLAYVAVIGFLATGWAVFFATGLEPVQERLLSYVFGVFSTIVVMVYSFEFGTSKDAAKMQNSMAKWLDEE